MEAAYCVLRTNYSLIIYVHTIGINGVMYIVYNVYRIIFDKISSTWLIQRKCCKNNLCFLVVLLYRSNRDFNWWILSRPDQILYNIWLVVCIYVLRISHFKIYNDRLSKQSTQMMLKIVCRILSSTDIWKIKSYYVQFEHSYMYKIQSNTIYHILYFYT